MHWFQDRSLDQDKFFGKIFGKTHEGGFLRSFVLRRVDDNYYFRDDAVVGIVHEN